MRIWFEDMDMEMETLDMKRANNSVEFREKSATFSTKMPDYFSKKIFNFREYQGDTAKIEILLFIQFHCYLTSIQCCIILEMTLE